MRGRVEALVIFFWIIAPVGAMCQSLPEEGEWDRILNLNEASEKELLESGLFTSFQVVSLLEYREYYGKLLSYGELSLIDGFNHQKVEDLLPYITLGESPEVISANGDRISNKIILRPDRGRYFFKYGDKVSAGMNISRAGSSAYFQIGDFRVGRSFCLESLVVGDFSIRMGQGLLIWNGFSMVGGENPGSLLRRGNTIYPYASNSPEGVFRGVAGRLSIGDKIKTTLFYSEQGEPVVGGRVSYEKESWRVGVNLLRWRSPDKSWGGGASADILYSINGYRFFSEVSTDSQGDIAALVGGHIPVNDKVECAFLLRWYSENYDGVFAGAYSSVSKCVNQRGGVYSVVWTPSNSVTVRSSGDVVYYPAPRYGVKIPSFEYESTLEGELSIGDDMCLKGRWRYRYYSHLSRRKYGVRFDYQYRPEGGLHGGLRVEAVWHSGEKELLSPGLACYVEGGWRSPDDKLDFTVRLTSYRVDEWDNRIYFYERDLPQSFSVPALYRRGWNLYAYIKYAPLRRVGLYLKVSKDKIKGQINLTF